MRPRDHEMTRSRSPLETELRRLISLAGPISVAEYMSLCLTHPEHGYYVTRGPIGVSGDFVTAPEISQMFGELLGLWAARAWQMMGSPKSVNLVELGPGRGTMMYDILRAVQVVPGFRDAVAVHLVEISSALEQRQRSMLGGGTIPMLWHKALSGVPEGPIIILANEFFDALPVRHAVRQIDGWYERVVTVDAAGNFSFALAREPIPQFGATLPARVRQAAPGEIFEWRSGGEAIELARRVTDAKGAALIIDYGHLQSATGDTLQAVGAHSFADPLATPGLVDLTAHVDFQALAQTAVSAGARPHGPIDQGEFLRRLGVEQRAAALRAHATPDQVQAIDVALRRLTAPGRADMGRLFKAMAIGSPTLGDLPGFEA